MGEGKGMSYGHHGYRIVSICTKVEKFGRYSQDTDARIGRA